MLFIFSFIKTESICCTGGDPCSSKFDSQPSNGLEALGALLLDQNFLLSYLLRLCKCLCGLFWSKSFHCFPGGRLRCALSKNLFYILIPSDDTCSVIKISLLRGCLARLCDRFWLQPKQWPHQTARTRLSNGFIKPSQITMRLCVFVSRRLCAIIDKELREVGSERSRAARGKKCNM